MGKTAAELERYSDLWWTAPKDKLADALRRSATTREQANIPQRWRSVVYFRELTGRPTPVQYLYGMAKRPEAFVGYYGGFQFSGVKSGFAATMCDVYTNRLLGHQTFISWIPDDGDWASRHKAIELEGWIEGAFDELDYWQHRATMAKEAFWYGTGFMWFDDDGNGNPVIEAVNQDELLFSNPDDTNPYDVIRRVWAKRTELLDRYKNDPAAVQAILDAPTVEPAFFFGTATLDCSDTVALLAGITRPLSKSKPGLRVLSIGNYLLRHEEWEYPLPFERWAFDEIPGCMFGQGIGEQLLQISQWIDALLTSVQESEIRNGKPKWMVEENSNVNADALGNLDAAIVTFLKTAPALENFEPIGQYALQHLNFLMQIGRARVHVSESAIKGEMPPGITAAVAMEKFAQIDDQNFLEKIGRLEALDKRCAYQLVILGKRLKPSFTKPGNPRQLIEWDKLKLTPRFRLQDLQAFNVGRIAQTVAGRIQILKEMYAEKRIDRTLYNKYSQIPDINGMFGEINATADDVQKQLDALVKSTSFIPPSPYMDFEYAKQAVESRYAREEADGAPQAVLDRLSIWRSQLMTLIEENSTPDGKQPVGPAFGIQPPADPNLLGTAAPPVAPAPGLPQLNNSQVPA